MRILRSAASSKATRSAKSAWVAGDASCSLGDGSIRHDVISGVRIACYSCGGNQCLCGLGREGFLMNAQLLSHREKTTRRNQARYEAGLCRTCDNLRLSGKTKCVMHAAEAREAVARQRKRKADAGLCASSKCDSKARLGQKWCDDCAAYHRANAKSIRKRRADAGLCVCGGILKPGERLCVSCVEYRREWGKCMSSEQKAKMWEAQGHKCNGCRHCFPTHGLEYDHIMPKSRGGSDNWDNMQLLCAACNRAKRDRTMEEAEAVGAFDKYWRNPVPNYVR